MQVRIGGRDLPAHAEPGQHQIKSIKGEMRSNAAANIGAQKNVGRTGAMIAGIDDQLGSGGVFAGGEVCTADARACRFRRFWCLALAVKACLMSH